MPSKPTDPKGRPLTVFKVRLGESADAQPQWLGVDCKPTTDEAQAVEFRIYERPTIGESTRVEFEVHELAGGLPAYLDIQVGSSRTREAAVRQLKADLGLPELDAEDRDGLAQQAKLLEAAWEQWDHALKRMTVQLQNQVERLWFLGRWKICGYQHPEGWEDLANHPNAEPFYVSILMAYGLAKAGAAPGKA
jgi:hypothetical protein